MHNRETTEGSQVEEDSQEKVKKKKANNNLIFKGK